MIRFGEYSCPDNTQSKLFPASLSYANLYDKNCMYNNFIRTTKPEMN